MPTPCISTKRRFFAPTAALGSLRLPLVMLWFCAPVAAAQSDLGQVLDAGGKQLTLEEFKQELVQRVLIGPTPAGGSLEIMYTTSGSIQGVGSPPGERALIPRPYNGRWVDGENESVCSTMLIGAGAGGGSTQLTLPRRCQFWFKIGERYYLSDSDTDRSVKVLLRTVKP